MGPRLFGSVSCRRRRLSLSFDDTQYPPSMTKEARVYCMTPRRTGHVLCTPPRYKVFSHRWSFGWQRPTGEVLNFSDALKTAVLVVLCLKAVHPSNHPFQTSDSYVLPTRYNRKFPGPWRLPSSFSPPPGIFSLFSWVSGIPQ